MVITPRIPLGEILDHILTDSGTRHLQACTLVSKSWVPLYRRYPFHTATFTSESVAEWFKTFLVPDMRPVHCVRDLRVWIKGSARVPEEFFEYTGGLRMRRGCLSWGTRGFLWCENLCITSRGYRNL